MRKELLKINDLNYIHSQEGKLENISLFILAGECVGFLGLSVSDFMSCHQIAHIS